MKKPYAKLFALGDEKIEAITKLLKRGESAVKVASVIQVEWKELTDMKLGALAKTLSRFKASHVDGTVLKELAAHAVQSKLSVIQKVETMEELAALIFAQKARIQKLAEKEAALPPGIVLNSLTDQIYLMNKLLENMAKLQLETGIIKRAPKNVTGELVKDPDDPNVVKFRITDEVKDAMLLIEDIKYGHAE